MSQSNGGASSCALVLLVDDHPLYREALRQRIVKEPGLTICGEAGTAADARRLCDEYKPDLILLDLRLPDGLSLVLLEESRGWEKPPKVLVVTAEPEDGTEAMQAMRLGAVGVVNKQAGGDEVLRAVRHVCDGHSYINDGQIARLIQRRRN